MGGCRSKTSHRVNADEEQSVNFSVPVTPAETTPFVSACGSSPYPSEDKERYDKENFEKIYTHANGVDEDMHSIQTVSNAISATNSSSTERLHHQDSSLKDNDRRRLSVSTIDISAVLSEHTTPEVETIEATSPSLSYSLPPAANLPEANFSKNEEESEMPVAENHSFSMPKILSSLRKKHGSPLYAPKEAPKDFFLTISNENDEPVKFSEASLIDLMPKSNFQFIALGLPADETKEKTFTEKHCNVVGNYPRDVLRKFGFGYSCRKGLKPESPNQDDYCILRTENWGFYGVFDGHGPHGHLISNFVHQLLPYTFLTNLKEGMDIKTSFQTAFAKVQLQLEEYCSVVDPELDLNMSGTTATIIFHCDSKLHLAHVGDSRAVLGQQNGCYCELTSDHKPTREDERARIEACGGEIRQLEGDIPYRVFLKGFLFPGLAMSRAFGDILGTTVGVVSEPEISEYILTPSDRFFILSSDGVWEFISSKEAVEIVSRIPKDQAQKAVEKLATESWNRWIAEEGNVVDDVTCLVVWF